MKFPEQSGGAHEPNCLAKEIADFNDRRSPIAICRRIAKE